MEASRVPLARRLLGRQPDHAFEQLYRRHARHVYQYALAVLSNPADAEDVTQTTFLNAYRAFQRGERPEKPHNWLIAIAHNVCRMRWRQAGSRPREVALEAAPEPVALDQERPDLDEVLTALAALSFNQRAALVMRELEGRSYQEIGEVLGVSVSAVEALLFRARRKLQVQRKALGVLTTVPLPGSLASLVGGGGGVVAAGGAALALKAAAIVALGAATAGFGYKSVQAVRAADAPRTAPSVAHRTHAHAARQTASAANRARHATADRRLRRAVARMAGPRFSRPTAASTVASAPVVQPSAPGTGPSQSTAAPAPPAVVVAVPTLPSVAPPAVQLPPAPPLPPPPVTVTVPPVPPLPPLPPPPHVP